MADGAVVVLWPGWFDGDLGYHDVTELQMDVEAAQAAGISRINIFYLTGLLAKENPLDWLAPAVSDPKPPKKDPFTRLLVELALPALDAIFW